LTSAPSSTTQFGDDLFALSGRQVAAELIETQSVLESFVVALVVAHFALVLGNLESPVSQFIPRANAVMTVHDATVLIDFNGDHDAVFTNVFLEGLELCGGESRKDLELVGFR
jgi:hypothetical protein